MIEGHGSDEHLGGYPFMIEYAIQDSIRNFKVKRSIELYKVYRNTIHAIDRKEEVWIEMKAILKLVVKAILGLGKKRSEFQKIIDWTINFKILPIVLRAFDRLTMASTIESRSPYMDYRLIEVFRELPDKYKVSSLGTKSILREILRKYDKQYIYSDKQKMGFASDIPEFYNSRNNKQEALKLIETFDMREHKEKLNAIKAFRKEQIEWNDVFDNSKVLLVAVANKMYNLKDDSNDEK